jgi:hypothetical protein
VRDPDGFARWIDAWRGEDGSADVVRAVLLVHDSVAVLAARAGERVVAGAILKRGANVVGISNFFADEDVVSPSWSGFLSIARSIFATSTFVGYESGDRLAAAQRDGFEIAGPLRVWIREDAVPARR